MAIDDPEEIDRAAASIRAASTRIGQEENKVRALIANLRFKSIDPGGAVPASVEGAVRQILAARTALEDVEKRMRRAAQDLRNQRVR